VGRFACTDLTPGWGQPAVPAPRARHFDAEKPLGESAPPCCGSASSLNWSLKPSLSSRPNQQGCKKQGHWLDAYEHSPCNCAVSPWPKHLVQGLLKCVHFCYPKRPLEAGIYGRSFPALKVPGWRAFCCVLVCEKEPQIV